MSLGLELLEAFASWAHADVLPAFPGAKVGIADQDIENIAWLHIETQQTICGIKLWDTGDYYLEVLTLTYEDPALAEFGELPEQVGFSEAFKPLFEKISEIEGA